MNFDLVIGSYNRPASLIRYLDSIDKFWCVEHDLRIYLVLQGDPSLYDEVVKYSSDKFSVNLIFIDKADKPIIGKIRKDVVEAYYKRRPQGGEPRIMVLSDDDITVVKDMTPLVISAQLMLDGHYGIITEEDDKCNKEVTLRNIIKEDVITCPGMGSWVMFNTVKHPSLPRYIFDMYMSNISVGEDLYMYIKAITMGLHVARITGVRGIFDWGRDVWSDTSANGGGLFEIAQSLNPDCPKGMGGRNRAIKKYGWSVHDIMFDFFHYQDAFRPYNRLRDDISDYCWHNTYSRGFTLRREHGPKLMEIDGSHDSSMPPKHLDSIQSKVDKWTGIINMFESGDQ